MRELVFLINGNLNQKNVFMKNTNSYFKPLVLLFLLSVIPSWGFAQSIRVQGVVNDNASESIIGANVTEKGTTNGVITDLDGKFSLSVQKGATLVISYIGYVTQEIPVENETELKVILKEDSKALEEVVVIGYGTARKSDVTGSIASVGGDKLREVPAADVSYALQNRIAGVDMSQTSSRPGATMQIRIRGTRSLSATNDPLIVLEEYRLWVALPISIPATSRVWIF